MNTDRSIFLLALCYMCVSSNDELYFDYFCEEHLETVTLSAQLGSSALLPCKVETNTVNWVSWVHTEVDLVRLSSEGRIKFLDPRYGRVKAFPNQGSEGNYSIRIDGLEVSDLGYYHCNWEQGCLQVEVVLENGTLSDDMRLLIYICTGAAAFILLSVGGYCCMKYILSCKKTTQDNTNSPAGVGTEAGASAPPPPVPVNEQQRAGGYSDNLVYENDDQDPANQLGDSSVPGVLPDPHRTQPGGIYPNLNQFNFERTESQRTKQRFHRELFNRLRQASLSRHYYVNQGEISRQQAMATQAASPQRAGLKKKKAKENCEYKNPIYNRSTEQLNQL